MATGSVTTLLGKKIYLNRANKTTPDYSIISQFKVGINNGTPNENSTDLDVPIPIEDGTVNDAGDNQFTGSDGGDNTTDNTSTYKQGAGLIDNTAQNLIANNTSVSKTWTSPDLGVSGSDMSGTQPFAIWLYIKDSTALAKFKTSGTCLDLRIRTNGDAANIYYQLTKTVANLTTGWNWITSGTTNVEDLTQGVGGAPSGDLDEFVIIITTNNATDEFVAGDVVYDLLRQWAESDIFSDYEDGYPIIDEVNLEITRRGVLSPLKANGFNLNAYADYNSDTTELMATEDVYTDEGKASTDRFVYVTKERLL